MHSLPERRQQMLAVHGPFIRQVVEASQTPGRQDDLELLLSTARHNGWDALVDALDKSWEGPVPFTVLIEPGGKIVYRQLNTIEPLELKRAIVNHLGRTYK